MDRSHLYQSLPRKAFSHCWHSHTRWLLATLTWGPSTPHLWTELSQSLPQNSTRVQWKHSPNQLIPRKNMFGLPFPVLLAQNNPWVSHPKRMMQLIPWTVRNHFYTSTSWKKKQENKNSKGKSKMLSGISPFIPDYMINLASVWIPPQADLCPYLIWSLAFIQKLHFPRNKQLQMVTYHLHGNKWKEHWRERKH